MVKKQYTIKTLDVNRMNTFKKEKVLKKLY
jgi:hypothetical protein